MIEREPRLVKSGTIWDTYFYEGNYIKVVKDNYFLKRGYHIDVLLETLKQKEYQMPQICKVIDIHYHLNQFYSYSCEEKKGNSIQDEIKKSINQLQTFYDFTCSFQNILLFAKIHQMTLKDIITKGNIRYDAKTKEAFLIDIDSIQIPEYYDRIFAKEIILSNIKRILFYLPKYYQQNRFTTEFNIFSFYELFLQMIFQKSLLNLPGSSLNELEKQGQQILDSIHLNRKSNLYGRILDLFHPNIENSLDPKDFQELAKHNRLSYLSKKLIRKR